MSTIEERLARDVAAVTGGVVVSESDLRTAREAVDERIDGRRQRNRRRILVAAAAAAVVIPILGLAAYQTIGDDQTAPPMSPAPPTQKADDPFLTGKPPTAELVQGMWRVDNGMVVLQFSPPNLVSFDDSGRLFHDPALQGTYQIDGDLITVNLDGGSADCAGQTYTMRASLPKPRLMRFVTEQPGIPGCSPMQGGDAGTLEQVLPTVARLAQIDNSVGPWTPLAATTPLYGDWMAQGGGHVLELAPGGAYYVADESLDLVDRGQWTHRGSTLTLTSSAASSECAEGDRLVVGGLEQVDPGTIVMRGTVEQNACGGAWAPKTWILIPDGRG